MDTKHKSSSARYLLVWAVLMALTALSFVGSLVDLGAAEPFVALGIAGAKTALVMLFFMHLVEARLVNAIVPVVCLAYVLLLSSLTTLDVATRRTFPPAPGIGLPSR